MGVPALRAFPFHLGFTTGGYHHRLGLCQPFGLEFRVRFQHPILRAYMGVSALRAFPFHLEFTTGGYHHRLGLCQPFGLELVHFTFKNLPQGNLFIPSAAQFPRFSYDSEEC